MATVLAALDNSQAVNPVLVMARALARVLGAHVEAIHVVGEGVDAAENAARAAGVPLRVASGPVVERLVEAGQAPGVAAAVIGARGTARSDHPLGSTAIAVVTSLPTPVAVVQPGARVAPRLRRILVPLESSLSYSLIPRSIVEPAKDAELDVVTLHVDEAVEDEAWLRKLLDRYSRRGIAEVHAELRTGTREDVVPLVADETGSDLIVLGWAQQLELGRTPLVRAVLDRSHVPVMLIPVLVASEVKEGAHR